MIRKTMFYFAGAIVAICLMSVTTKADGFLCEDEKRVVSGIQIENVDVSGMDKAELSDWIDSYVKDYGKKEVALSLDGTKNKVNVPLSELKLSVDKQVDYDNMLQYGNKGNIMQKLSERIYIIGNNKNIELRLLANENSIKKVLNNAKDTLNIKAVDGSIKRENGAFVITEGITGVTIDDSKAIKKIEEYLNDELKDSDDMLIKLPSTKLKPRGTREDLEQITDVLGTFSTIYTGTAGRKSNVANGAGRINGSIIYPNEVFSVYECVSPFDKAHGYELAGSYENGTVVQTYGGGICQVSSTLYNAALMSELKIVERSAHSMMVSYLDPSKDAAISGTAKDFKFENNTEYPIYIEGSTNGSKITFSIYGHDTRPAERSIKYVSEIISTTEPDVKYVQVDKPIGYKNVLQSAHIGHKAKLWKIITENGIETKELVNNSSYRASPRIVEIGVKSDDPDAVSAIKDALQSKDKEVVQNALDEWKNKKVEKENTEDNTDSEYADDDDWTDGTE